MYSLLRHFKLPALPWVIIVARCFLFCLVMLGFTQLTEPQTPTIVLQIAAVIGILLGARGAHSRLTGVAAVVLIALGIISAYGLTQLLILADGYIYPSKFVLFRFSEHLNLCLYLGLLLIATTWAYFSSRTWIFLESITLFLGGIKLLSAHRNLRFDSPQWVADFSWWLGISQLTALIVIGMILLGGLTAYLTIGSLVHTEHPQATPLHSQQRRLLAPGLISIAICLVCVLIGSEIHRFYTKLAGDRLANGVGQNSQVGESPLGFYSSLGGSSEPAALLRLEGDYHNNPLEPLLYLRENALSEINSLGMTVGTFDDDIPNNPPLTRYAHQEINELVERQVLVQSVYLLTNHETAFAVDYPIEIVPLKNPNTNRFVAAYRATSLVPSYPLERLEYATVGNPKWEPEIRAHYTKTHPDERYGEKAREITKEATNDIQKAFVIQEYFNKNAIYTLSPDHQISEDEDPVAPFLFGDLRGYCVHFAHASVYMLRALGIPARIATGYLTDLSQSKDGHTLLRMNDRHSWPEVYVTERGWVPFDVTPEQVESHANTEMNVKLLEELMNMLEPGEEILPKDILEDEKWPNPPTIIDTLTWRTLWLSLAALMIGLILLKLYLLYGWRYVKNPRKKLRLAYRSILLQLYDLGIERRAAQTRIEFSNKLTLNQLPFKLKLTQPLVESAYSDTCSISAEEIRTLYQDDIEQLRHLPWTMRLRGNLNPSSVLAFLGGKSW